MTSYFLRTLFVHTPGTRLVLDGDAVRALRDGAPPRRLPLNAIDSLVVLSGIDISTPLLTRCAEDGRVVAILSRYGKPRATVEGPVSGRGRLRASQYRRQFDASSRDELARSIVHGKIGQMTWGIRQWARDASGQVESQLNAIAAALQDDQEGLIGVTRDQSLGVEGAATRRYFGGLALALKDSNFPGRNRRPATDPVNAVLSFLYAMTRLSVHGAVHAAGLDPFCGYLHGDRDGQPSLVLDLMEEFRPAADRVAVTLFNRRQLRGEHFQTEVAGAVTLTDGGREVVMDAWHQHRQREARIRSVRMLVPNAAIPIVQANLLANAFRNATSYRAHALVVQ